MKGMTKQTLITVLVLIGLGLGISSTSRAQESYPSNSAVRAAEKASDFSDWKAEGTFVDGISKVRSIVDYRINDRLKIKVRPGKKTRVAMSWTF